MLHFVAPYVALWIAISYKRANECSTVAPCTGGGPIHFRSFHVRCSAFASTDLTAPLTGSDGFPDGLEIHKCLIMRSVDELTGKTTLGDPLITGLQPPSWLSSPVKPSQAQSSHLHPAP